MAMTMAKKFASASGMRSGSRADRLGERHAERLVLDDLLELRRDRLLRLRGDDLQAVDQRQAGLDAAHDHVDGVREIRC